MVVAETALAVEPLPRATELARETPEPEPMAMAFAAVTVAARPIATPDVPAAEILAPEPSATLSVPAVCAPKPRAVEFAAVALTVLVGLPAINVPIANAP